MAYCIYLRKSRADDELEAMGEDTLARHEKTLLALAKSKSLAITAIYREVVSGETIASRPQMQQLLNDVENNVWQGVLVMEVERLARGDTIDQGVVAQTFKYANTHIITPNKTYNPNNEFDEEYFEFGLFMSRREYKTINRRLQRGRITSVNEGKWVGNKAPYGYIRKKLLHEKGYTLEISPEEADIVRLIYDLFLNQDMGCTLIARHLNALGVPTASGLKWSTQTVSLIIKNPVYYGKIKWGGRPEVKRVVDGQVVVSRPRTPLESLILVNGLHEPLISEETFNRALDKISDNPLVGISIGTEVKNPIVGLIKCGMCGKNMVRRAYKDRESTLLCTTLDCKNVSSDLYLVEDKLIKCLQEYLDNYKSSYDKATKPALHNPLVKLLEAKIAEQARLKSQLSSLYDLLEQGIYTREVFLERNASLNERISVAALEIEQLENDITKAKNEAKMQHDIIPKIEAVISTYYTLDTPKQRNDLLKTVVEKATYLKTVSGRWHGSPSDFSLALMVKV